MWVADVLAGIGVAQTDSDTVILHAEFIENNLNEFNTAQHLFSELLFGHEQVGVVLGEASNTGHP